MAGISSAGIGSGLDINELVGKMLAYERAPVQTRLDTKEAGLQAKLSAFGTLKSTLSSLQDALQGLKDLEAGRTATSGDADSVGVSATKDAASGTYRITVSQLASAQSLASNAFDDPATALGTGTLTLQVGDGAAKTINIDAEHNSLQGIAAAINDADAGVSASLVNDGSGYRLVLNSVDTGAANEISLTVADDDGNSSDASGLLALARNNLTETVAARDAEFTINGLDITSASNDNDTAIQGLTLNLKNLTGDGPVTVTVDADRKAVEGALKKLVDAYNKFNDQAKNLTAYDPDHPERAGLLLGDSTLRTVAGKLQNALIHTVADAPADFDNLVDIGITTDRNGKMQLESERLDKALNADFGATVSMLNEAARGLNDTVDGLVRTGGVFDSRTDGIQRQLDDISGQREDLELRMDQLQKTLMQQFTAMDVLVGQLQNTSHYLTQQLANLPLAGNSSQR